MAFTSCNIFQYRSHLVSCAWRRGSAEIFELQPCIPNVSVRLYQQNSLDVKKWLPHNLVHYAPAQTRGVVKHIVWLRFTTGSLPSAIKHISKTVSRTLNDEKWNRLAQCTLVAIVWQRGGQDGCFPCQLSTCSSCLAAQLVSSLSLPPSECFCQRLFPVFSQ